MSKHRESEEKLLAYVRDLEQKNDDVERCHRAMMETVDDIQVQLNSQIEKNALLETELDEKDALQTMVQRLKDEQRDLQQELQRQLRQRFPDNDRVRSPIDSNKLGEPQTVPASPVKSKASRRKLSRALTESCFSSPRQKPPSPASLPLAKSPSWASSPDLTQSAGSRRFKLFKSKIPRSKGASSRGFFRRIFK